MAHIGRFHEDLRRFDSRSGAVEQRDGDPAIRVGRAVARAERLGQSQ